MSVFIIKCGELIHSPVVTKKGIVGDVGKLCGREDEDETCFHDGSAAARVKYVVWPNSTVFLVYKIRWLRSRSRYILKVQHINNCAGPNTKAK